MKVLATVDTKKILCPFKPNKSEMVGGFLHCDGTDCMAWLVVGKKVEREDHSGAKEIMYDLARTRNQELKRKGPPGSTGILFLEEIGKCVRLYPH